MPPMLSDHWQKVSEVLIQVEIPTQEPHLSVFYNLFTWNGSSKHTKLSTSYHEQADILLVTLKINVYTT